MRDHDSGVTLTFTADDLDRVMGGLLTGDRHALILADEINKRWRAALAASRPPATTGAGDEGLPTPAPRAHDGDAPPHDEIKYLSPCWCYIGPPRVPGPAFSPPATDGDAARDECPTCGGIHRHGGDCHGEGKPVRDTETETRAP